MESKTLKDRLDFLTEELHELRIQIDEDNFVDKLTHVQRELASAITHGLGVVFFLIAIPILMSYCAKNATLTYTLSAGVFAFGLMMVYLSSTLYHSIQHKVTKRAMRILDHISIFLLIGGSYTPIVLHYLDPKIAVPFLAILWIIVFIGSVFKVFFTGRYRLFSTLIYVGLAWLVLFVIQPLKTMMPPVLFNWLLIGGAFYMVGVPFYLWRNYKYAHAIWHVFVLGGSISHFLVVLKAA